MLAKCIRGANTTWEGNANPALQSLHNTRRSSR